MPDPESPDAPPAPAPEPPKVTNEKVVVPSDPEVAAESAPAGPPRWLASSAVKVGLARVREIVNSHGLNPGLRAKALAVMDAIESGADAKALEKIIGES